MKCYCILADIMSADRQLAKEIEFDLRKFEEEQQEAELRRQEAARRKSGAQQTPRVNL